MVAKTSEKLQKCYRPNKNRDQSTPPFVSYDPNFFVLHTINDIVKIIAATAIVGHCFKVGSFLSNFMCK